jgi:hypothetical protein
MMPRSGAVRSRAVALSISLIVAAGGAGAAPASGQSSSPLHDDTPNVVQGAANPDDLADDADRVSAKSDSAR